MTLLNFGLSSDGIALLWQGYELDLHNNFNFHSLRYTLPAQKVELRWVRSSEEWARHEQLPGLMLVFKQVNFFRVKERDHAYPPTEDDCLCHASFHPPTAREEYDTIYLKTTPDDDLTFFFQSEWGIKENAESAELIPLTTAEV